MLSFLCKYLYAKNNWKNIWNEYLFPKEFIDLSFWISSDLVIPKDYPKTLIATLWKFGRCWASVDTSNQKPERLVWDANIPWWIKYITWQGSKPDHEGASSRVRFLHCTSPGLTPAITANVSNKSCQCKICKTFIANLGYLDWFFFFKWYECISLSIWITIFFTRSCNWR